jgi:hypothetical protein
VSLENLLKIGQLKPHASEAAEIERLLIAARRNLGDARVTRISPETRFDAAYKAIMQSALAARSCSSAPPEVGKEPGCQLRSGTSQLLVCAQTSTSGRRADNVNSVTTGSGVRASSIRR